MKKYIVAFVISIAAIACAQAQTPTLENTIQDFSMCDSSFFSKLHSDSALWSPYAHIESKGDFSWLKVPERGEDNSKNEVSFITSPEITGVKFLSYLDAIADFGQAGMVYLWGFTVEGNPEDIAKKLHPLIANSERLKQSEKEYFRLESRPPNSSEWYISNVSGNKLVGNFITNRNLFIAPAKGLKNVSNFMCSLSGNVTAKTLADLRPDIDPKDYSEHLQPNAFEDAIIPDDVIKKTNNAYKDNDFWKPKFKSITYTTVDQSEVFHHANFSTITIDVLPNDLLRIKEVADENIFTNKLSMAGVAKNIFTEQISFAGIMPIKVRTSIFSSSFINVISKVKISLPKKLEAGDAAYFEGESIFMPLRKNSTPVPQIVNCDEEEKIDAKTINIAIHGMATKLLCHVIAPGLPLVKSERLFLDDYGIAIPLTSDMPPLGATTVKIINFHEQD